MTPEIERAIKIYADGAGLPIQMVHALVLVESDGDQWAYNPEPKYRYFVDARTGRPFRKVTGIEIADKIPPKDFPSNPAKRDDVDAEWWGQQASWGLMQVMGAVAREYGFTGWLPQLCDVSVGLQYGCKHLAILRDRHFKRYGWNGVLSAYNTGQPDSDNGKIYIAKVIKVNGGEFA